ncbi:MAG: hypothetical protein LBF56_01630 [Holosporales bacterium]|jgi:uncharacterized heparinase superfamily protein|nr:hypothetical protein [Holosporales bacterium]
MQRGLKHLRRAWDFYRISFIKRSVFYRFSLSRKHTIFDTARFITDPWAGDSRVGRAILDSSSYVHAGNETPTDILDSITGKSHENVRYAASFAWIRDLQALGGNSSRKYVRNLISLFIARYRRKRRFYIDHDTWSYTIIGERIVNWMFSYSFFASGSNDKFQREVLSSIAEQFSHLVKCYKEELNPYSRLMALKAILFCLCSMKTPHKYKIQRTLDEICEIIEENTDEGGMFGMRSPVDHFHIFRSLIEIRFIARNFGLDLPSSVFTETISKMALVIRFLRLGDGSISQHSGTLTNDNSVFVPSRYMVDTALSVVEIKTYKIKPYGFDRLETKKATIIVNTESCNSRSKFNNFSEPGINVFDFETSFGDKKLINRADISVVVNNFRIKLNEKAKSFARKGAKDTYVFFEGEARFSSKFFEFTMKREITIFSDRQRVDCADSLRISENADVSIRIVFNRYTDIKEVGKRSVLLGLGKAEYIFSCTASDADDFWTIHVPNSSNYPTIEIISSLSGHKEIKFEWSVEFIK